MKNNDFVLVTNRGVMGQKGMSAEAVLAKLLYGFLKVWNDEIYQVDIGEATAQIISTLRKLHEDRKEKVETPYDDGLDGLINLLFGEDDDGGET